jgi:hypothetical protein
MTYVRVYSGKDDTLLTRKFNGRMRTLNIRADIGPHIGNPHIDVEIFGTNSNKLYSSKVKQDNEFPNYESAISVVFMQVEKLSNALIGAQYWLSPLGIFQERVEKLAQLRAQYKIQTPLCVLSRLINIQAYEKTRRGSHIYFELCSSRLCQGFCHIQIRQSINKKRR